MTFLEKKFYVQRENYMRLPWRFVLGLNCSLLLGENEGSLISSPILQKIQGADHLRKPAP